MSNEHTADTDETDSDDAPWYMTTDGARIARKNQEGVHYPRDVEVELDVRVPLRVPEDLDDNEIHAAALYLLREDGNYEVESSTVHDQPDPPEFL